MYSLDMWYISRTQQFFLKPVYLKRTLFILNGMGEFQLVSTKIGIYHLSKRKDD